MALAGSHVLIVIEQLPGEDVLTCCIEASATFLLYCELLPSFRDSDSFVSQGQCLELCTFNSLIGSIMYTTKELS